MAITKEGKSLLSAIVGSESDGSYNLLNGGKRFSDYSNHPYAKTNAAFGSHVAAGKYQFMPATWNEYKRKLSLPDFSPASQDAAAYALASDRYKSNTGGDLQTALENNEMEKVAKALSGTWTSLPYGKEPNKQTAGFYERYQNAQGGTSAQSVSDKIAEYLPDSVKEAYRKTMETSAFGQIVQATNGIVEDVQSTENESSWYNSAIVMAASITLVLTGAFIKGRK